MNPIFSFLDFREADYFSAVCVSYGLAAGVCGLPPFLRSGPADFGPALAVRADLFAQNGATFPGTDRKPQGVRRVYDSLNLYRFEGTTERLEKSQPDKAGIHIGRQKVCRRQERISSG